MAVQVRQCRPRRRAIRLTRDQRFQHVTKRRVLVRRVLPVVAPIAQVQFVERRVPRWCGTQRPRHRLHEHAVDVADRRHHPIDDVILEREDVGCGEIAVVGIGPEMDTLLGVDELGADANAVGRHPHAPLDDVARGDAGSSRSLRVRACARGDGKVREARQSKRDVIGEATGERFGIAATLGRKRLHDHPQ